MAKSNKVKRPQEEIDKENRERFLKVATRRVRGAIKQIKLLGNCAGSGYKYEPDEPDKMIKAIMDTLSDTNDKFGLKVKDKTEFSFTE